MSKLPLKYSSSKIEFNAPKLDWTDHFDRQLIVKYANKLIDELILEIHAKALSIHKTNKLNTKEIALLYRWPIHVGTNIFIERLLRVAYQKDLNITQIYPATERKPIYYENTTRAVQSYYWDFELNYNLLNKISFILNGSKRLYEKEAIEFPKPQDSLVIDKSSGIIKIVKKTLKTLIEFYVKITKPEKIGEYSDWMRDVLPLNNMLWFDLPENVYQVDILAREQIKTCCKEILLKYLKLIYNNIDEKQRIELSELFADFVNHILPLSLIEGLNERFEYYKKLIRNWSIKRVHSFTGYYYTENFKIFAILAKRKNALLVGHQHGVDIPLTLFKNTSNELAFVDLFIAWGKKDCNWMKGDRKFDHLKIISLGSPYLWKIPKRKTTLIDSEIIQVFYPSGPLMDFMADLQEITPERNNQHRIKVLNLFKELWKIYPNIRILYKPFPGTYTNDPIKDVFAEEFKVGKIKLVNNRPMTLFHKVDMVLWDSISTGFSESIRSGVPTLVYQSRYEYELATSEGKALCEKLMECGMVFYDTESGIKSFSMVINDLPGFIRMRKRPVMKFQETTAYPVSKSEFRRKLNLELSGLK